MPLIVPEFLDPIHQNVTSPPGKPNVANLNKPISQIKSEALDNVLKLVSKVDFYVVCKNLGWIPKVVNSVERPPQQKHYKVAIIHELMRVAKTHNWHLIRDEGYSYIYNGAFWISLDKPELKNLLKDVAIKQGYPEIEARDSSFINKLYDQALQDGFFQEKRFEKQSMINLQNGTLVLNADGVKLKQFNYKDLLTHQLPFCYELEVINHIFLKFLDEVLPDKETQKTLQEVIGYLFIKGLKLEKIVFLYGTGANGKSVIFEVINGLLGDENISHFSLESLTDGTGYFRAKIKDKIVNYGTDIKLSKIDAGMFKTLASGEPIEARLPYGEPFIISDYAKLIFNVNRLANANIEHTHGFYRRILIIPFNQTIADENQNKRLHEQILKNKAGVLNWVIEGAERVLRNQDIIVSNECRKFKADFIRETDSVAMYMESVGYISDDMKRVMLKELYCSYKDFCGEDNYRALGKGNFSKRLEAIGFGKDKSEHGIYFKISIKRK